ncbi:MAG: nitrogen regulation protein NR(II) [Candidatus Methylomirabilales bacterium]
MRSRSGKRYRVRGSHKDITEHKQIGGEIARLASFPEDNPNPVIEIDAAGSITYLNPAARAQYPDLLTLGPRHPILEGVTAAVAAVHSEGKGSLSREIEVGDRVYEEQIYAVPGRNFIQIYTSDITKRKRVEEALRRLEKAFETMQLGVTIADTEGRILYTNPAEASMHGYTVEELIGKDMRIFAPRELWRPITPERMKQMKGWRREGVNIRKDGSTFPVQLMSDVVTNVAGDPIGIVTSCEDITERKRAEEQLKQTNAELARSENTLRKALSDLQKVHEESQDCQLQLMQAAKFDSVGRLAAGVAHEVKNPLMTIFLGADYLSKHVTTENDNVAVVLKDISEAVRRADSIIKGLVDFSAPTQLNLKDEALNAVVEEALELVKNALISSHITVVKELRQNLPPLRLDRQKIAQVFVNLFMNAIQAMSEGGKLIVKTSSQPLTELGPDVGRRRTDRSRLRETVVVAEVEDTGTGIPEDQLDKVFDPFFTTKPTGQGTGLGLAVTNSIIELHGGVIDIRNRNEGGVRVSMMFSAKERRPNDGEETNLDR